MQSVPPPNVYYLPRPPRMNGNAIASMVLGILSWVIFLGLVCFNFTIGWAVVAGTYGAGLLCLAPLCCISPLLWFIGIITGHAAKSQISSRGEGGEGMAVAGLILNWLGFLLVVGATLVIIVLTLLGVVSLGALSIPFLDPSFYY